MNVVVTKRYAYKADLAPAASEYHCCESLLEYNQTLIILLNNGTKEQVRHLYM